MLNYKFLVLGFVIVGLLFAPTTIPYMIPIAEASPMDNPADAINDLALSSISKYGNQADRNSITLSWSAPNDNGSPILFYNIQVHEISGNGWTVLENDVYGTTYTHENAPTPYQFSYRVFAIAADGCNGSSSTFYNACNESNILHVVSLPNAESGAVNSSCNNSDLDDCGYFDTDLYFTDLYFSGNRVAPEPWGGDFYRGAANYYIDGSVKNVGSGIADDVSMHIKIVKPDGSVLCDGCYTTWSTPRSLNPNQDSVFHNSADNEILSSFALGTYTVTITVDPDNVVDETDETNNVWTGTFTVVEPPTGSVDLYFSGNRVAPEPWGGDFYRGAANYYIDGSVKNVGSGIADDVSMHIKIVKPDGSVLCDGCYTTWSTPRSLNPNQDSVFHNSADNEILSSFALGTYTVTITVDPDNVVDETDETNNVWTGTFTVVEPPTGSVDLYFSGNRVAPEPWGGDFYRGAANYYIDGSVKNVGSGIADDVSMHIKIVKPDGSVLCDGCYTTWSTPRSLNPNQDSVFHNSADNEILSSFALGTYTVTITVDPDNVVYETDETNNVWTGTFTVVPPPPSATVSVDSLNIGQNNSKNGGDCDSVGTWVPSPAGFDVGGTCTLTKDIQITGTGVGITIAWSGVTLDGAGHTVTGTQTDGYDHVGVKTCNQCYHMAIKNLEITNFAYGIFSNYAHGLIITGVTVTDVGKTAMSLGGSSRLIVEGNTIDVNIPNSWYGGINIHTNNAYAHLANGSCETTDSMYSTNMIMVPWEWREGLVVIKNNVLNGAALSISEQDGYCIDGNTISDSPGMTISNSNNNMIKNNVITAGNLGIASSGSTLDSNTVTGGSIGFHNTGTANIFTNNIANDNSQHGFKFEPDTPPLTFTDNVATGNGVSDIEGYAVAVDDPLSNVDLYSKNIHITPQPSGVTAFSPGNTFASVLMNMGNSGTGIAQNVRVDLLVTKPDGTVWLDLTAGLTEVVGPGGSLQADTYTAIPENFPIGTYTYTFTIDPDNTVAETNENNNVHTGTFEVVEAVELPVDLYSKNIHITPQPSGVTAFSPGNTFASVLMNMGNSGTGIAQNVRVDLLVTKPDGTVWLDLTAGLTEVVGPGGSLQADTYTAIPENFPIGTYTYTFTIDPDNTVAETNENNNVHTGTFEVVEAVELPVDLYSKNIHITPQPSGVTAFSPGNTFASVLMNMGNSGTGIAQNVRVDLLVTKPDGTVWLDLTAGLTEVVGPGGSLQADTYTAIPENFPIGTYTYTFTIDPDNTVAETNENNNVHTGTFEVVEIQQTCFTASGYSAPWTSDPDTSSRDVQISGKLTPKQNGECLSSDAFSLEGQSVLVTATKNGVIKTATGTTFNVGLFNSIITFDDDSDEGAWDVTFTFEGQDLYLPTTEFINGMESFTVVVPAPPPNPIPIVNVPSDITLYTGTPSFSFAQSTINYNLYSGNSGPVFYPQPTASITGVSSEVVTFDVTATDNDLSSGPTCDVTSGSTFPVGTTTVTCSASDFDGGVGTASFDVTVIENTISGSPTCTPGSNSQFQVGSTPVSCSVTDGQGNVSTDTFAVNVQPKSPLSDSQCRAAAGGGHDSDSVFVCEYPFHVTVEEGQRLVWVDTQPWQGFYHHSLTSNNYLFDHTDAGVMDMLPSAWGGVGVYSFYDKLNTALSGTITIAESDTTAPNVNVPNDLVISTEDQNGTPIVTYSVSATDDREVVSGPTCDIQSGSTFSIGTTEVTCTASDAAGNTGTDSFDVTVEYTYIDTTPPGFTAYDNISKATTNPAGTVVTYTLPTVTDNIEVTSGPTCDVPSGSVFPIGTTEVTCTASDAANNSASISFDVVMTKTYVDDTAPAVYITFGETSDEIAVAADSSSGKELGFTVNAIDNVGVTVGPTCSDAGASLGVTPSGDAGYYAIDSKMYPIGVSIVVCTASDAAGNSGSSMFAVTIQPEPENTTPQNNSINTDKESYTRNETITVSGYSPDTVRVEFMKYDAGGGLSGWIGSGHGGNYQYQIDLSSDLSNSDYNAGYYVLNIKNSEGVILNSKQVGIGLSNDDGVSPVFDIIPDISVSTSNPMGAPNYYELPVATDSGYSMISTCTPSPGHVFLVGTTTTVTCTATDVTGKVGTSSFSISTTYADSSSPRGAVTQPVTIDVGGKAVYLDADDDGNFVVGLEGNQIKKYDVNNNLVISFSDNWLNGVGFDSSGNIIVANGDYKIKKYDSDGQFLQDIANLPSRPFRMEVDSNDNVFVTSDAGNYVGKIYKVTPLGAVSTVYTESSDPSLVGIGVDTSGNLYVGQNFKDGKYNKCCKIMKYSSSGSMITSMGGWWGNNPPAAAGFTRSIQDVAIHPLTGNVYAADQGNDRISVFTPSGTFVKQIGSVGVLLNDPYGVAFDSFGNLYVTQRTNSNQVMIFPPNYSDPASNDSTPPTITQIQNIERYTAYSSGSVVSWNLASQDNELVASQECNHTSGSNFPVGTTTVTCTAIDNAGNKNTMSFDITQIFSEITSNTITSDKDSYVFGIDQKAIITGTVLNMDSGFVWVESYAPNGSGGGGQVEVYGGHFSTEKWLSNNYYEQHTVKLKTVGSCYPNCNVLDTVSFTVTQPSQDELDDNIRLLNTRFIQTVNESGFPQDCVDTGCYTPSNITVDVGDLINMTNSDPSGMMHTFTSGTVDGFTPSPDGTFDSGVLMSGDSIEWIPQTEGVVPYYCMLHIWMTGTIFVGDSDPLTSTLNQNFYTTGDTMILSGYSNSTNSITHQLFTEGNLVEIAQLDVGPDGSFSHTMITEGPLWNPGDYLSKVTDSQDNIIEKQFSFTVTFGEFTKFAKSQEFSNSMTFEKYQHFEDSTDFTAISQTFKEGTTFGDGTTFRSDGTQSLPAGTIPSFGVMLEEFSCVTADCKPADTSKFLSPGDFLPSGIDPAASFSRITSADKSFTIDGLGLVMTFDNVSGDGTIKTDLYDPANIPSSTDAGNGKVSVITNTSESISTIGSVIDLSVDTATVSGSITITMPYLESNVPAGTAESDLVVLHYTNNQWVTESNCTVDTLNNKITCIVTELSPFGIGSRSVTQTSENEINLDVDTTPPEFEEVNNILVDATTSNGATVTYEIPMATDDGGITDTPVCEPESGSFFPIGTTPVTCTVKDIAGIQGATVFLVTVKSLIAAPVEIPNDISIKIGKSDYNTKEAIFVSGVASPFTEDNVSINVQDQSDNMVLVEQITPEFSGVYTGIIFPTSLWSVSGNYTMSATYGTATDSVPFTFEFIQTEIDNSNIPTGITLNTNATGYALGDVISVKSQLTGGTSGQSIIIDVKDESGDNVVLQSLNTDDSGSTSLNFKAQDNWIPGTYNVTARDGSALWDYSTSELIQLVRPLPDITISPTVTTTESGDVITSYKAGEIGYFSTVLLSESTSNVLVTINVVDSESATLGVAFFKSIIGKGDSEIVLGFKIPEDAADGVAKIYVNTYTDWIDQGGIAISSELLSEVNIEGVISVENVSEDGTVLVIPKSGSSIPGCEQSIQGCYLPNPVIINVGDTVSFSNTDTEPHTFTSGSPSNGPNGIFDSSVLMSGEKYEFTFEDEGKYDYFDMIRPWMAGTIVVGNSESFTVLPENIIPKFSDISDITQSASSSVGNTISYPLPIAIGGVIASGTTCTPAPGSMFPIGSTQVTCTATNEVGNTGMTSFMVTINPILQTADQSLSVKVGKDLYNNLEPLFVTGSVGTVTGEPINLQVYDELNHLISIEQTTPKESGVYNTIITSNELWSTSGEYIIIANYASASAQDTFEFELIEVEKIISEQIPTELYVSTDNSVYILGDDVFIDMQLVDAGAGEPILLEVRDSQNDQVLLQSLNTDSDGNANISYQLESTHDSGIYSVIVTSANWDFITTEIFVAVAQIPDIIVGDVVPTLQDGTEVDSFEVGDIGYFQTPIISNSISNVLIAVNIFDVENTPLGLAYFNSKVVDDTFDIVLGLQIPENVTPGLATVYINTYTDWADEGGVPILEEQVSFIEISPSSVSDLTLSTNPTSTNSTETVP